MLLDVTGTGLVPLRLWTAIENNGLLPQILNSMGQQRVVTF